MVAHALTNLVPRLEFLVAILIATVLGAVLIVILFNLVNRVVALESPPTTQGPPVLTALPILLNAKAPALRLMVSKALIPMPLGTLQMKGRYMAS